MSKPEPDYQLAQIALRQTVEDCLALVGASALARVCGVTPAAVQQWRKVPSRHLAAVCALTGLTPARLRPDLAEAMRCEPQNEPQNEGRAR